MKFITLEKTIPDILHKQRLDIALSQLFPDYSRSLIQQWIKNGAVMIDNAIIQKPRFAVQTGQSIIIRAEMTEQTEWTAESIPLSIVYEDEFLIVVNKPIGLVVHPGAGNPDHTLVNALLHHAPELTHIPRAGIIHRLDKDTSGLLVVAKTLASHHALIKAMQARQIHREYRAIVKGDMISGDTIDAPIARHPTQRTKMAVVKTGKPAVTHYRVLERFRGHTLLAVQLETGRTHQIRVHMAHMHYPIVGDTLYGKIRDNPQLPKTINNAIREFSHQALHAYKLALTHPITHQPCEWLAPIPDDMKALIVLLREDARNDDFF